MNTPKKKPGISNESAVENGPVPGQTEGKPLKRFQDDDDDDFDDAISDDFSSFDELESFDDDDDY
jgi:hypothetical protein